ncbi:hypothetical protein, partial [Bacillus cereus]|uniref:hypothetical protein n=1 Tax=Bacillus cereus TaxID=1396 RepID=UPI002405FC72
AERITTKERRIAKAVFSLTVALHETVCSLTSGWEGIRILSQFQAICKLVQLPWYSPQLLCLMDNFGSLGGFEYGLRFFNLEQDLRLQSE